LPPPGALQPAVTDAATDAAADAVTDMPMYQIDPVLRRSAPLQRTRDGRAGAPQRHAGPA